MPDLDDWLEGEETDHPPFPVRPEPRLLPFTSDDLGSIFRRMEEGPGVHYGSLMLDPYGEHHENCWIDRRPWRDCESV